MRSLHRPDLQLDLLDTLAGPPKLPALEDAGPSLHAFSHAAASKPRRFKVADPNARPLHIAIAWLDEDPDSPRTDFPDADIDELADDIRQRGILQPIVVHPADAAGRHRLHFGAKRLRAARRAGLTEVPVMVRPAAVDAYAQVAENQKRRGLSPLELARFIKSRVDAGESNARISGALGMSLTTVAHHLTLLDLPPELDDALKSGRCTSPRTLHELSTLHDENPEQVRALVASDGPITRTAVAALRQAPAPATTGVAALPSATAQLARVHAACARLEQALVRLKKAESEMTDADRASLQQRLADLATRWSGV